MKKIVCVIVAMISIASVSFAQTQNSVTSMWADRSQFYLMKRLATVNEPKMETQINFAVHHNDTKNLDHWIEIKHTVYLQNGITESDNRTFLGLKELMINNTTLVITDKNTTVQRKVDKRKVTEITRIAITQELFDQLSNQQQYTLLVKANYFPAEKITLSKGEAARFTNGAQKIKHDRDNR